MLLTTGDNYQADTSDIIAWQRAYPDANVHQEIMKMESWCDANPNRRRDKDGIKGFIVMWLGNAQNRESSTKSKIKNEETSLRSMTMQMQIADVSWVALEDRQNAIQFFLAKYGHYYLNGELHHGS